MRPLKIPLFWLTLGWLLVLAACVGSLIPGRHLPMPGQFDKLLHGGTYLLLTLWFAGIYERSRYLFIALGFGLLGLGLELGQRLVISRAFDRFDLTANLIGICVGLVLALTFLGGWCQHVERWVFRSAGSSS